MPSTSPSSSLDVVRAPAAVVLLYIYAVADFSLLSCLALLAGTNLLLRLLFSQWLRTRSWMAPPAFTHRELASAVQALICAPLILPNLEQRALQVILVVVALWSVGSGARTALLATLPAIALRRLRAAQGDNALPLVSVPYVLIAGGGAMSTSLLNAWTASLTQTLWSTRQQARPPLPLRNPNLESLSGKAKLREAARDVWNTTTSRWLSRRSLVALVPLEHIERFTESERQLVIDNSAALLGLHTRGRLWLAIAGVTPEESERLREALHAAVTAVPVLGLFVGRLRASAVTLNEERRLDALFHYAGGPVALLVPELPGEIDDGVDDDSRDRLRGYELVSTPRRNVAIATPQVTNLIATVALPLERSQRRLDARARETSRAIGATGLAPLADAYLRFRLAGSAVERFLSLFDCFEVLIKYSVFVLSSSDAHLLETLARPSMGMWIAALRERLGRLHAAPTPLILAVSEYWQHSLSDRPRELIDLVSGSGMAWPSAVPRSHLGWLNWLVWLRNATRGHGAVVEKSSLLIWHDFHATLLDTVSSLRPLALEAAIRTETTDETPVSLRGWLRGPFRSSTLDMDPSQLSTSTPRVVLEHGGGLTSLQPFVRCEGNACLTWNSGQDGAAEYLDYGTGRVARRSYTLAE